MSYGGGAVLGGGGNGARYSAASTTGGGGGGGAYQAAGVYNTPGRESGGLPHAPSGAYSASSSYYSQQGGAPLPPQVSTYVAKESADGSSVIRLWPPSCLPVSPLNSSPPLYRPPLSLFLPPQYGATAGPGSRLSGGGGLGLNGGVGGGPVGPGSPVTAITAAGGGAVCTCLRAD